MVSSHRIISLGIAIALILGFAVGERTASAQGMRPPPAVTTKPPFDLADPKVVEEGSHLFRRSCTGYCHGAEGRLSRAPSLRGREFDPRYLYQRISGGSPPMPAFETIMPPEDIWKLVAYIESLRDAKD